MDILPNVQTRNGPQSLLPLSRTESRALPGERTLEPTYSGIAQELYTTERQMPQIEGLQLPPSEMQALE